MTLLGNDVYIIGGSTANNQAVQLISDIPLPTLDSMSEQRSSFSIAGHGSVVVGSKAYLVCGAQDLLKPEYSPAVQLFDPTSGNVTPVTFSGKLPPRQGHTVTMAGNKAFVLGGLYSDANNTKPLSDVWTLDFSSNTATQVNVNGLPPVYGHSTVAVNDYLVSCFGLSNQTVLRNDCVIFDTNKMTFVPAQISGTPPPARTLSTMVASADNKTIVVFGGGAPSGKFLNVFNDLYILDTTKIPNLVWSTPKMSSSSPSLQPSARAGHSALAMGIGSEIMMIWGGINNLTLVDTTPYFLDMTKMSWIDKATAAQQLTTMSNSAQNSKGNGAASAPGGSDSGSSSVAPIAVGVTLGILAVVACVGFFIFRRRRQQRERMQQEFLDDPYVRPGGQLHNGSFKSLPGVDTKSSSRESVALGKMTSTDRSDAPGVEMAAASATNADISKNFVFPQRKSVASDISDTTTSDTTTVVASKRQTMTNMSSSASIKSKRGHRRTSSVSISSADLPPPPALHTGHFAESSSGNPPRRDSLTWNVHGGNSNRKSMSRRNVASSPLAVPEPAARPEKFTSNLAPKMSKFWRVSSTSKRSANVATDNEDVKEEKIEFDPSPSNPHKEARRKSSSSYKSVNSIQWIGFNGDQINETDSLRDDLFVRNLSQNLASDDGAYAHYDVCDDDDFQPMERHSYSGDFLDRDEVIAAHDGQRRSSAPYYYPSRHSLLTKPRGEDIVEEEEEDMVEYGVARRVQPTNPTGGLRVMNESEEPDRNDPFVTSEEIAAERRARHQQKSVDDPFSSEEDFARESKRSSRVSFAALDEVIEYDESQSPKRLSWNSSQLRREGGSSTNNLDTMAEEEYDDASDDEWEAMGVDGGHNAVEQILYPSAGEAMEPSRLSSALSMTSPANSGRPASGVDQGEVEDEEDYDYFASPISRPIKIDLGRNFDENNRISRFSFSVYDFTGVDVPLPSNAAETQKQHQKSSPSTHVTSSNENSQANLGDQRRTMEIGRVGSPVRNSFAEFIQGEGLDVATFL